MASVSEYEDYRSPLATRYASKQMRYNFSEQNKFSTWRRLWIYLAKAEMVEESGIVDENGHIEIKKTYIHPMNKITKNSNEKFLNHSMYIEDGRNGFDSFPTNEVISHKYRNSPWTNPIVKRKPKQNDNYFTEYMKNKYASSECGDIQEKKYPRQFTNVLPNKMRIPNKNNFNHRKLRDVNGNLRTYKSELELSKYTPTKLHKHYLTNQLIYQRHHMEKENNIPYDMNILIPAPYDYLCMNHCVNYAGSEAEIHNQNIVKNSLDDLSSYFNRNMNLQSASSVNGDHQSRNENFPYNFTSNHNFEPLTNCGNNGLIVADGNHSMPVESAIPRVNYNVYQENINAVGDNTENYNLQHIQYDSANFIPQDKSVRQNYRGDNNAYSCTFIQNEFTPIDATNGISSNYASILNNNRNLYLRNGMGMHVPQFNTKSFGLGKPSFDSSLMIRDGDESRQLLKQPRPILSRNRFTHI